MTRPEVDPGATAAPGGPGLDLRLGLGVERPAGRRVLVAAGAGAVLTDLAVRAGVAGLGGALLVGAVVAGLLAAGRLKNPQAVGAVAASAVFGACLAVRTSPWLVPFDIVAAAGLLTLGASIARGGSVLDLPVPQIVARTLHALAHGLAAPAFLAAPVGRRRSAAVLRGVGLAVPLLVVLGVLLASADAVFAGFFRWWSPLTLIGHAVLLTVGAWGMGGLLRLASAEPAPAPPRMSLRLGHVEATVVLASLVGLFAAFAAAQVVALSAGGRHVIATAGLTYAQYARSGFFQLLAVASITLVALLGLRGVTDLGDPARRRRFTTLAELAVALTLVIVGVALRRLDLYQQAFGLTMLRLYSSVFAAWIGVVVLLAGCALAGVGGRRSWLPAAAATTGLAVLLALNLVNPEAVVVRRDVDLTTRTERVDPAYLAELSDDAVPALVDALPHLPEPARAQILAAVCDGAEPPFHGWAALNASHRRAVDARRRVCAPPAR
jgi:hypothetical protein